MFLCGTFDQKVNMTGRFNTFLPPQVNCIKHEWEFDTAV